MNEKISDGVVGSADALDLDALRKLANSATPGPWWNHRREANAVWWGDEKAVYDYDDDPDWDEEPPPCDVIAHVETPLDHDLGVSCANAEFIAAARSAVPALIAEVERLRAQWRNGLCGEEDVLRYERDGAQAEVERLTQQRDSAREWTVRLEQQNAEALRVARDYWLGPRGPETHLTALLDIERILGAFPDDETEQQ